MAGEPRRGGNWTIDVTALVEHLRATDAAITAAIADLRGRHVEGKSSWLGIPCCTACKEPWPCPDALLADRLTAALGEGRGTEGEVATK